MPPPTTLAPLGSWAVSSFFGSSAFFEPSHRAATRPASATAPTTPYFIMGLLLIRSVVSPGRRPDRGGSGRPGGRDHGAHGSAARDRFRSMILIGRFEGLAHRTFGI